MDWHSVKGGVVILLVWDNFRLVGSLGSSSDFVVVSIDALRLVMNVFLIIFFFVSALFWKILWLFSLLVL